MVCPYCGEQMKDTAKFCMNCGKKLPVAGEQPAAPEIAARPEGEAPFAAAQAGIPAEETPMPGAAPGAAGEQPAPGEGPSFGTPDENGPKPPFEGKEPEGQTPPQGNRPPEAAPVQQPASASAPASVSWAPTFEEVILAVACLVEILWLARLFGIVALIFTLRAYFKRHNGDEEAAAGSRKTALILLLVGIGVKFVGWIFGIIFKVGAVSTIIGWLKGFLGGLL